MKCKECIYYSGIQCHGHGDYWGSCQLLDNLFNYMQKIRICDYVSTGFRDIVFDETYCIIIKNLGFEPKIIGGKNEN